MSIEKTKHNGQKELVASIMNIYKAENPRSGIEIRDRYHSPYKEIIEAQYTEEDIRLYNINITYKTIIKGEEARKCASRWKREVLNET